MTLANKIQRCQALRQQIDKIVTDDLYSVEQVTELSQQLFILLQHPANLEGNTPEYAAFLQQNLDWLQALMAQLSKEKDTVAASILKIQQGRRARHSYGQQN
jgi:hypothetical protein